MKKTFLFSLFFLLVSVSSLSARAGSLTIHVGYFPYSYPPYSFLGAYSTFPYSYYYRASTPIFSPIELPRIDLTSRLIALGESKKMAWLQAKETKTPLMTTQNHSPETYQIDHYPEVPEIKTNSTNEL